MADFHISNFICIHAERPGPRRRLASGCRVVEAAAPTVAALPPAAWLSGPRDPWLIELHPLIRLSLRQLAANLKYGCLLSYLTLLPPTRCCRRAHIHSHTRTCTQHTAETECPIYSGAIKVGPFCDFSFALSCFVKVVIFHRLALTAARTLPNSWPWHAVRVISLFFCLFCCFFSAGFTDCLASWLSQQCWCSSSSLHTQSEHFHILPHLYLLSFLKKCIWIMYIL